MPERVAIVTGGSAGIGASICTHLLDAGWGVVSMSRRATEIDHPALHSVEVDLGDVAATRAAAIERALPSHRHRSQCGRDAPRAAR
jgi:3-oxoacyl-[acyl-carrier protein] reductase